MKLQFYRWPLKLLRARCSPRSRSDRERWESVVVSSGSLSRFLSDNLPDRYSYLFKSHFGVDADAEIVEGGCFPDSTTSRFLIAGRLATARTW